MPDTDRYVLITGAGSGLGRSLAFELAEKGYNLALISLLPHELENVKNEVTAKYPMVTIKLFPADLLLPDSPVKVKQWVEEQNIQLGGLVNNVGMGYSGRFENLEPGLIARLLQLNVVVTTSLCHLLVNNLIAAKPSFILNVASMAAFFPLPYKTVYAASKSFVLTFSRGLRQELKEKGVQVNCICPGPMITNDEVRNRIANIGWRRKIVSIAEPEKIARIAVQGIIKNKSVMVPMMNDKLSLMARAIIPPPLLPRILRRLSRNSF